LPARKGFTLPEERQAKPRWIVLSVAAHVAFVAVLLKMYSGFVFSRVEKPAVYAIAIPSGSQGTQRHSAPPPATPPKATIAPRSVPGIS